MAELEVVNLGGSRDYHPTCVPQELPEGARAGITTKHTPAGRLLLDGFGTRCKGCGKLVTENAD